MSAQWWEAGDSPHGAVWEHIDAIGRSAAEISRTNRIEINTRLYEHDVFRYRSRTGALGVTALNFIKSALDTIISRLAFNMAAIKAKAEDAPWSIKRKARDIDKLLLGELEYRGVHQINPVCFRDMLVAGAAATYTYGRDGAVRVDRVPVEEIKVDERECRYGQPRTMHRVQRVDKSVLSAMYPDKKGEIAVATQPPGDSGEASAGVSRIVEVATSWHLPSAKGAKDGKWCISTRNATLHLGEWKSEKFPIRVMQYCKPRLGFWGISAVDEVIGVQRQIDKMLLMFVQNMDATGSLKVLKRRSARVEDGHLTGYKPHVLEVDNPGDVQWIAPDGFSAAQFQLLQWLIGQVYDILGISQAGATSKDELGPDASGAARREYYDYESLRLQDLERTYSRFQLDTADAVLDAARSLAEEGEELAGDAGKLIEKMKDIDMERDRFALSLEPANFLPQTRAGKLAAVEDLAKNGIISGADASGLIDFPDLSRANRVRNAPRNLNEWAMQQLAQVEFDSNGNVLPDKTAPFPEPDSYYDLGRGIEMANGELAHLRTEEAPPEVIERFDRWIQKADAILGKQAVQPAAQPVGMLPPGPAPTSLPGQALPGMMPA